MSPISFGPADADQVYMIKSQRNMGAVTRKNHDYILTQSHRIWIGYPVSLSAFGHDLEWNKGLAPFRFDQLFP